jgi:SecD/SecF fusion protein
MLNLSINQTLSRTILTGLTTMFVLIILYFWGGTGIHGFAYCLFIGMIVGTYSSIYVASPILLWLMHPGRGQAKQGGEPKFAKSSYTADRQRA